MGILFEFTPLNPKTLNGAGAGEPGTGGAGAETGVGAAGWVGVGWALVWEEGGGFGLGFRFCPRFSCSLF